MDQTERRKYLISELLNEEPRYRDTEIPESSSEQKFLLRALMNVRMPKKISPDFLDVQNEYLKETNFKKGIVSISDMQTMQNGMYIWQGDITRLKVDAIVNAANSGMTGCYLPNHNCIDNCIHTYAGIQLRFFCAEMMDEQGYEEPTGQAKITPGFNLPCKYVIHTVGPIVAGPLTNEHRRLLKSCYLSCLKLADENGCESIAFCCISTGVFCFPNDEAAKIAVDTVKEYKNTTGSKIEVVFNVFKDEDYYIYQDLLG